MDRGKELKSSFFGGGGGRRGECQKITIQVKATFKSSTLLLSLDVPSSTYIQGYKVENLY